MSELTVTYNTNGGSGMPPTRQVFIAGESVTLETQGDLYRNGYKFVGWNTKSNGKGESYEAGQTIKISENITLYAEWVEQKTYTITYDANKGSGTPPAILAFTGGDSVTISSQGGLTRSGYSFGGWCTKSNGKDVIYAPGETVKFSGNTKLYAIWI